MPAIGCADCGGDGRDFVLGLEGGDAELLEPREVVQDRRSRGDRIAAEEQVQPGQLRACNEAVADRLGTRDGAVQARLAGGGREMILLERPRKLRRLAIGVAGIERGDIGLGQHRCLGEFALEPVDQRLPVTVEHPQREAERPHVLAAQRFLVAKAEGLHRFERQRRDVESKHLPLLETAVLERADIVLRLLEVALVELAGVGDDQAARLERAHIGLERRRVHRDEHVGRIARGIDLGRAEVDLERRDAKQRALRRADFSREIGEGRQIVAGKRGRERELAAGELHAITRVARETHHDRFGRRSKIAPAGVAFGFALKNCRHMILCYPRGPLSALPRPLAHLASSWGAYALI